MLSISGTRITEQLHESAYSLVYRGYRQPSEQPVIVKMLKDLYPSPERLAWFKREYEVTRNLNLAGVVTAIALETHQQRLVMVLEDFGGDSLARLGLAGKFELSEFLKVAIAVTEILGQIHTANIIHKDINPSNIVLNPMTGQVKIIDFGISTVLSRENSSFRSPNVVEGTLTYISPEQTGRMNRAIDYRTDFYSLGVTFYELLTGNLPFQSEDALELVHSHIAKQPIPPHLVEETRAIASLQLPPIVSEIVLKLMAKNAEDRYQSAYGLMADLECCRHQLEAKGQIDSFVLGTQDISDKFQIPQKLYGRERQIETLLASFERITNGQTEMILVAGYSGVGKSALVHEVHKPITAKRGNFISGKFDQYQRNIPYYALSQAFNELCYQFLTESTDVLNEWQTKILAVVGNNGQVLIDVIPNLELVIGKQPPVGTVGASEAQNRFNLVFEDFIKAISQAEHPLVLFIDDLQWADGASLTLLKTIMSDVSSQYLLIIGAYRDNEVDAAHPLVMTLEDIKKKSGFISSIHLENLSQPDVNALIAEALACPATSSQPLTDLVYDKTQGNAFFTTEFLKSLYAENLLSFDPRDRCWRWNVAQVQAKNITDNVIELMAGKIGKLAAKTQTVLQLAACIGNTFDLSTLAIIYEHKNAEVLEDLWAALHSGLVVPLSDRYKLVEVSPENNTQSDKISFKFLHDRVQQAAYLLIEETQKQLTHLQIGRLLLANIVPSQGSISGEIKEKLEEYIFDIVNQLNKGIALIREEAEKLKLAELNLIAAQKAKAATAYEGMLRYLKAGQQLLAENSWSTQYELTKKIYLELAECEYVRGNFAEAESLLDFLLLQLKTNLEKAQVYSQKILLYTSLGKAKEGVELGIEGLKLLGINWPNHPTKKTVRQLILNTKEKIFEKNFEDLINWPLMTDPEKITIMSLIIRVGGPIYFYDLNFYYLVHCQTINMSLEYGNANATVRGYAVYGLILGCELGDYEAGYKLGQLSFAIAEKFNNSELKGYSLFLQGFYLNPWRKHLSAIIDVLAKAYQWCLDAGNLAHASFSIGFRQSTIFMAGMNLDYVYEDSQKYLDFVKRANTPDMINYITLLQQMALSLKGLTQSTSSLTDTNFDEVHFQENLKGGRGLQFSRNLYFVLKLQLLYLAGNFEEAEAIARESKNFLLSTAKGLLVVAEHYFYYSLTLTALYPLAEKSVKESYIKIIKINQKTIKKWADSCPENFLHKYFLIAAEIAFILGKSQKSADLYDESIKYAKENKFTQDEALGNELAAKYYFSKGKNNIARSYLKEAQYCYQIWGAKAKVDELEKLYPELLAQRSLSSNTTTTRISTTSTKTSTALDLTSVLKASQALSGEIVLDTLLAKIMKIVIENAGAEKGYLILDKVGEWAIAASGTVASDEVKVWSSLPSEKVGTSRDNSIVGNAIVNYVIRTKESIVLNDAVKEGNFTRDSYIIKQQPKSVLCAPLLNQGKLAGILYLENNLTSGAFTPDRLEVLNLLSSQAAISIENAKLYTQLEDYSHMLEHKVEQRTAELAEATRQAQEANKAKSTFLANMSHELRSPLNAILGFSQLMTRSQTLPAEHQENLGIISRSGEHLLTLINNVLDLSKIEAGRTTLHETDFDLYRLLNDVEDMFYLKAENKGLQLLFERPSDIPQYIRTDEVKLRQVLINLLNNALKFTPDGSVLVRVGLSDRTNVETLQSTSLRRLIFEVEDTGAGIAPDELDSLFEAFVQTKTGKESQEGTGLGLPISRSFVQLMGGEMTVNSEVGKGTVFKFDIDISIADRPEITKKPTRRVIALEPHQPRYRILIVDDKWDNRQLLIKLLNPLGFELREASNGIEAVEVWNSWEPHLIWMDMRMPVMDGYEATKQIKSTTKGQATAIIALTASGLEEERAVFLSAGCDDFLRKPCREEEICETMNKHLGVRYVYEDITDGKSRTNAATEEDIQVALTPTVLATLSFDLLTNLEEAAIRCKMDLVDSLINEIRTLNAPLADALAILAQSFDYPKIVTLTHQAKESISD